VGVARDEDEAVAKAAGKFPYADLRIIILAEDRAWSDTLASSGLTVHFIS
jgi:hypothetical protein